MECFILDMVVFFSLFFFICSPKNNRDRACENAYVERPGKVIQPFTDDIGQFRNTLICRVRGREGTGEELHFRSLKLQGTPWKFQNSAMRRVFPVWGYIRNHKPLWNYLQESQYGIMSLSKAAFHIIWGKQNYILISQSTNNNCIHFPEWDSRYPYTNWILKPIL